MTDKNERSYWIERKGYTKYRDTAAERGLAKCVETIGGRLDEAKPVNVRMVRELPGLREPIHEIAWLTLTPDGWIRVPGFEEVYGYADGIHHWSTHQRNKDRRLRGQLAKCGVRSIGVDSPLLELREHHAYVALEILEFLMTSEPVKQLEA